MIDWNELWKKEYRRDADGDQREFWNNFAPRYRKKLPEGEDLYPEQFYEYAALTEGETVFDMGCGSGTLAIPFAKKGHEIWAADFSPEMLKHLMADAAEEGVEDRIHPLRLDWNEDWSLRDDIPSCDVAVSSRSFFSKDLSDGIRHLEDAAKKRVCIGAWDTPVSGFIREIAERIGYERPGWGCYVYIMGELMDLDRMPRLRWISNPFRRSVFETREEAETKIRASFQRGLTARQEEKLSDYLREHLVQAERSGRPVWKVDLEEISTIAFISWDIR